MGETNILCHKARGITELTKQEIDLVCGGSTIINASISFLVGCAYSLLVDCSEIRRQEDGHAGAPSICMAFMFGCYGLMFYFGGKVVLEHLDGLE